MSGVSRSGSTTLTLVQVPRDYAVKVCNQFARLGSLGTTVFFSSGDLG